MLPAHVVAQIKAGLKVDPEHFESTTIFFSDIVGFTDISAMLPPTAVMVRVAYLRRGATDRTWLQWSCRFGHDAPSPTKHMSPLSIPAQDMLDRLFSKFDEICHRHRIFKVETIGDGATVFFDRLCDESFLLNRPTQTQGRGPIHDTEPTAD